MPDFPVIDISTFAGASPGVRQWLAARVDEVCRQTGFLAIVGHGIPEEVINGASSTARSFFDLSLDKKLEVRMPHVGYPYGYAPLQTEALAGSLGDETPPDLKESFSIGPPEWSAVDAEFSELDFRLAPNLWPAAPVEFKAAWSAYYRTMSQLAARLMEIFAVALDLPQDFFDDKIDQHCSALRAINYPDQSAPPKPGQLRAGAHTDYGSVTILLSEPDPGGLEIYTPEGEWLTVPSVPDAFIVNIGDLLARWTNDRWVSTLHRVVCPPPDERGPTRRQSIAFFHQPNWDAEISCLPTCLAPGEKAKCPPVSSGAHLREKFRRSLPREIAVIGPDEVPGSGLLCSLMKRILPLSFLFLLLTPLLAQQKQSPMEHIHGVGHVHMDVSCSPSLSADFDFALDSRVLYLISIVRGRPSSATVILLGVLADLTMKLNFRAPGL